MQTDPITWRKNMNKDLSPFWILCIITIPLFAAVALAEFLKWLDTQPTLKTQIGL